MISRGGFLVVAALLAAAAWPASRTRVVTYDEASHAHMAWLLDRGQVPYRDFAANHLPFFWMLVRPLASRLADPLRTMNLARGLALAGHLAFLLLLAAHAARGRDSGARACALGALAFMALLPPVLPFLVEFRPDSLSNPLLAGGLWLLRGRPSRRRAAAGGFLVVAAMLINTKLLLLPVVLAAAALWRADDRRAAWARAGWAAGGAGLALLLAAGVLKGYGIDPRAAWQSAVAYNAALERMHTFGAGLWRALRDQPLPLACAAAGAAGWGWRVARRRERAGAFETGVVLFLLLQAVLATKPWLQYTASWFLLAAVLPAALAARAAEEWPRWWLGPAALVLVLLALRALTAPAAEQGPVIRFADGSRFSPTRTVQARALRYLLDRAAPHDRVVAAFPWHPLCRSNTFYKIISDFDGRGHDGLEWAARNLPGFPRADRLTPEGYRSELEERPPAVVFLGILSEGGPAWSPYSEAQTRALEAFFDAHGAEYGMAEIPGTPFTVMQRVDNTRPAP
ncbi:MAG TPA: hypothetical protein P5567_03905 [Kiritimatiellia bacterium]|nr:hypothetical protein [Kiritimatiellia bacterium]HRZ11581.1 hypothetical protein [Kiritimatiellia bacterium]HSA16868.1 hypothetical protein [Kiritimatiellia bacterium]